MIRRIRPLLGTFVEIGIKAAEDCDASDYLAYIERAFKVIEKIQQLLSFQDPLSELSKLNAAPFRWHNMDAKSVAVLRLAKDMGRLSDEKFNCTLGGALVMKKVLPLLVQHKFLLRGHSEAIEIDGNQIRLAEPVLITLDGIAKGYAVDQAVQQLAEDNVSAGWVNAGGDLRVFGDCALSLRQREAEQFSQVKRVYDTAVASSRLALESDHDFPALLLNGQYGSNLATAPIGKAQIVTVAAKETWRADALTKIVASLAEHERHIYLQRFDAYCVQFKYDSLPNG